MILVLLVFILVFGVQSWCVYSGDSVSPPDIHIDVPFVSFNVFLQVVKTGGTPKVPDCFQRTPKKLCIPEKAEILAVNVDSKGGSLFLYVSVYT